MQRQTILNNAPMIVHRPRGLWSKLVAALLWADQRYRDKQTLERATDEQLRDIGLHRDQVTRLSPPNRTLW
ncbi:MAG: hypothetical protein AAGA19_06490 [Pseudomonadota bacterium]